MAPKKTKKPSMMQRQRQLSAQQQQVKQASSNKLPPGKKGGAVTKPPTATSKPSPIKPVRVRDLGPTKPKPLSGASQRALPPGRPGGSLARSGGGSLATKAGGLSAGGVASRALGALGIAGGTAAEIQKMRDRAARDAERNKKLNRRPFEELRADSRTRPSGSSTQTGQGSRKPTAPKPTDKQIAALTQKGGIFYQGPGKPKDTPKPSVSDKSKTKPTVSKTEPTVSKTEPKPKPQGQSKDMGENYRRWAAANPKLAAKVKEGQAGYAELKGSKAKPTASKKGSTSPSSAVKPPDKSKPKPQNFLSLSERMKKKRGY